MQLQNPLVGKEYEPAEFKYPDTASSRLYTAEVSNKLAAINAIAIVGIGGTGSYILDLVAKTPVKSIHIFDGDHFENHNAYRAPGAADLKSVSDMPNKAEYFRRVYRKMRNNIFAYGYDIDEFTVKNLQRMDFVFLAADLRIHRIFVAEKLEEYGVPFIDVGMDVNRNDENILGGCLRVTTSTEQSRQLAKSFLPAQRVEEDIEYLENIQIADLNALNAALAVIKWKKIAGFYRDLGSDYNADYMVDKNHIINYSQP